MDDPFDARRRTLDRYWSLFDADAGALDRLVAATFTDDGRFESAALAAPLVGHAALAGRVRELRELLDGVAVLPRTDVQWSHAAARWCWSWSDAAGTTSGMDVAHFDPVDHRISRLTVFAGLLPAPSGGAS